MMNVSGIIDRIYQKCRIFQTENGYLGLGPKAMAKGDMVCVLFGSNAPVVLRKDEKGYIHIGVCFILGFMDGEGISSMSPAMLESAEVEFEIR